MDMDEILRSKIGEIFTLSTGERVRVVNGFSCYEADYLEIVNIGDASEKVYRINITDMRILKSPDFK
ncbi:hypothetical protein [Paenibacillus anaericanus]|uniref:hypothetical protein n=1 Tax=Paenibacillus anaericanus TaxID=170367 RepID=UPI0027D80EE1|nr:hypothetical protein [Paenibacillus anaericanus]